MFPRFWIFLFGLGLLVTPHLFGQTAEEILKKADEVRNPAESFAMKVAVEDSEGETAMFHVQTKGKDRTLIYTLSPARDKGRNLLMVEANMWAYVPNLKRAVRVSLNQKLIGQAANGDLSRMRWSGDYDVTIESQKPEAWTLFLTAKRPGLTYDKIRLHVSKDKFHPIEADYLSLAGEVLKKVEFRNYREMAGALRPGLMVIRDAKQKNKVSHLTIRDLKPAHYPDSLFSQSSLEP